MEKTRITSRARGMALKSYTNVFIIALVVLTEIARSFCPGTSGYLDKFFA